jgi:thioredoxin 1
VPVGKPTAAAKCGVCHKPLFTGHAVPVTADRFDKHISRDDIPVVVDFWAEWCGPCRMISPALEEIASELDGKVKIAKLNIDENPQTAVKYGVRSIPTLILFKNGEPTSMQVGAAPKGRLADWIKGAM